MSDPLERYFVAVDRYLKNKTQKNDDALSEAMRHVQEHVVCSRGSCECRLALEARRSKKTSTTHLRRRECHL